MSDAGAASYRVWLKKTQRRAIPGCLGYAVPGFAHFLSQTL